MVGVARQDAPAEMPVSQAESVPEGLPLLRAADAWSELKTRMVNVNNVQNRMAQTPPVPVVNSASTFISFVLLTSSRSLERIDPVENASSEIMAVGVSVDP